MDHDLHESSRPMKYDDDRPLHEPFAEDLGRRLHGTAANWCATRMPVRTPWARTSARDRLAVQPGPTPSRGHFTALHRGGSLAIGLALRSLHDRFLAEDDPRRFYIAQVVLYGGTFIVIAVSVWLRHRW